MLLRSVFIAVLCAVSTLASAADKPRPNVLFIAVDDLNHWVGHLGRNPQTKTPNIDRLAARGVAFSRAYCAAPVCNPSRAALMSGLRPGQSGVYDNGQDWRKAIPLDLPLTTTFRKAGYYVCGSGKIYHGAYERFEEWDDYLRNEGGEPKKLGKNAKNDGVGGIKFAPLDCNDEDMPDYRIVSYGIEQLQKKRDQPLFLAVGLHKPHMAWNVPQKYYDQFPLDSIQLPPYKPDDLSDVPAGGIKFAKPQGDHAEIVASGRWKEAVQGYLAAIAFCDAMIGRLMDAFDQSPYRDNTVIVFWGDHGWHLGEKDHWRKFALWEEATRAPLIWVAPGITPSNSVCERTVDFMSIYPTLCDLCGIEIPSHVKGPSLRPLLANPKAAWDQPGITTFHLNNHAVRTEGFRYIRYADGGEELYDETRDKYEWTNLAGDPQYKSTKEKLAKLLPPDNVPEQPMVRGKDQPANKKNKQKS